MFYERYLHFRHSKYVMSLMTEIESLKQEMLSTKDKLRNSEESRASMEREADCKIERYTLYLLSIHLWKNPIPLFVRVLFFWLFWIILILFLTFVIVNFWLFFFIFILTYPPFCSLFFIVIFHRFCFFSMFPLFQFSS